MTNKNPGPIRRLFSAIGRLYRGFRSVILNLLFIGLVVVIAMSIFGGDDEVEVPPTAALVLNLTGDLVEEKRWTDPIATAINESLGGQEEAPEVLVSDVVTVIKQASSDNRIQALVLDLSMLGRASLDKMQLIGTAMGTSVAVIFANLYYGWHEKTCILPHYNTKDNCPLVFYRRFIDDIFGIWVGTDLQFESLKKMPTALAY